jgi:hypothetical protein
MPLRLRKVMYKHLSAPQQESYNFQKVSAVLADYGFATIRLSDDWQGADFIAQHYDGDLFFRIQLKGRLSFDKKYSGKEIKVVFPYKGNWYIYDHDDLLLVAFSHGIVEKTKSWIENGSYTFPSISKKLLSAEELTKL